MVLYQKILIHVVAIFTEAINTNTKVEIQKLNFDEENEYNRDAKNDMFMVRKIVCDRKISENTSLNRHIISASISLLLKNIEKIYSENSSIIAMNTDSITIY